MTTARGRRDGPTRRGTARHDTTPAPGTTPRHDTTRHGTTRHDDMRSDMAEVLLFHHGHGLTDGVREFADALTAVGHEVHVPDLYEGQVFDELEKGLAYARQVGFDVI